MNPNTSLRLASNDTALEPEHAETSGLTMIVCALLVAVCFAAPLLLSLPHAMDAAASPAPTISEAVGVAAVPTFHERHPVQAGVDWVDSLEQAEIAQWRMRASD